MSHKAYGFEDAKDIMKMSRKRNIEEAVRMLGQAITDHPMDVQIPCELANRLQAKQRTAQALEVLEEAIRRIGRRKEFLGLLAKLNR